MKLDGIRPDDIVEVDKKGRKFKADVEAVHPLKVLIKPICRNISYRYAGAKEIVGHWRRAGRSRRNGTRPAG